MGEKVRDSSPKVDNNECGKFVQPPTKKNKADNDEPLLKWLVQRQRESKSKEKVVDTGGKVTRTNSTRGSEKKLLGYAMKDSKLYAAKRR